MLVLRGEICRDAHFSLAKGSVGQMACVRVPSIGPVVWRPVGKQLSQPLHQLLASPLHGHKLVLKGAAVRVETRLILLPFGVTIVAVLDRASGHHHVIATFGAVAANVATIFVVALVTRAKVRDGLGRQLCTAALSAVEVDLAVSLLRTGPNCELGEASLTAGTVHKLSKLPEGARCLTVGRTLGAATARTRCGPFLVILTVPFRTLGMPPTERLPHESTRRAGTFLKVALFDAEAFGL
mmetsp:Transcript_13120/g.38578  ORF Transcript_13120/g.38578 Transcript_13120/m.38578 type:complete len:239 (-) Transcript_13120:700-1416(-)